MNTQRFTSLRPGADIPNLLASNVARRLPSDEGSGVRSWYDIRNLSQAEAEVSIYDEIGFWGVTADDFIKDLNKVTAPTISLRINSPGGDVFDGIAIYNAIKRHKATVNVHVDGLAASAASFIAMAGDKVTMSTHSQLMIHDAWGLAIGPAEDMRKMADMLDKSSDNIAAIYANRAGGTKDEWRDKMRAETWLTDREAVDAGLADLVDGDSDEDVAARKNARALALVEDEAPPEEPEQIAPEPITPKAIDWKAVFQEAVDMAEDELFVPVEEAV
jgi:ATP-dependent Clp endopeptidase proteolytic subunit ClpP